LGKTDNSMVGTVIILDISNHEQRKDLISTFVTKMYLLYDLLNKCTF